ncbi:MAG: Fic family protein [Spirochaetes bacterium]|nr:Fic family protein [Spirochaetota bacterium]
MYRQLQAADIINGKSGKLMQTARGYLAYIPNPLEPQIDLSLSIVKELSAADRALSELAGITRTLPNPHFLIGPFLRREAVLSSRIEGTQASFSDLLFFEAARMREKEVPDVHEVSNCVQALEYGLARLSTLPVSLRLMRESHQRLMAGVRGESQTPGEFRRSQNWIGPAGCSLSDATYVPPPVEEMHAALDGFEKYLHTPSEMPSLIRLALVHYQFEAIHPFLDGNGRVGRLLVTLLLCAEKLLPQPLLCLSSYFERYQDDYYRNLLAVSQKGAWEQWIRYFLKAVAIQSRDAIQRIDHLLTLRQEYRTRMQQGRASALLLRLIDELFAFPAITNPAICERMKITPRSAQLNIDKLVDRGMLQEATGRQRNRVYVATEIVDIIERQEK